MNTGLRGDSAVLLASSKLVEAGLILLKPISECLKFDLVVYDGIGFITLQIKRAYAKSVGDPRKFLISLRMITMTANGAVARKYSEKDVDFVLGVVIETGDIYSFPISVAANRNCLTLNPFNIESKFINKNATNTEPYKNIITLHNRTYNL
jgi:hypothetical protein